MYKLKKHIDGLPSNRNGLDSLRPSYSQLEAKPQKHGNVGRLNMKRAGSALAFITALFSSVLMTPTYAADAAEYPTRPIRMVVPFAAGQTADILARLISAEAAKTLNANFIIDNKPGAGSLIGATDAARAPADGYTLLFVSAP